VAAPDQKTRKPGGFGIRGWKHQKLLGRSKLQPIMLTLKYNDEFRRLEFVPCQSRPSRIAPVGNVTTVPADGLASLLLFGSTAFSPFGTNGWLSGMT
jgi:hypothetical protein